MMILWLNQLFGICGYRLLMHLIINAMADQVVAGNSNPILHHNSNPRSLQTNQGYIDTKWLHSVPVANRSAPLQNLRESQNTKYV